MRQSTLVATIFALLAAGCQDDECTIDQRRPTEAVVAVECASDQFCYRGDCVEACFSGTDRTERCESDSDCGSSQPSCLQGRCSACQGTEVCLPGINVCQEIVSIPVPEQPPAEPFPLPDRPRPPGGLDAGLELRPPEEPPDQTIPVSHTVFVDVFREQIRQVDGSDVVIRNFDGIDVRTFDVRGNPADLAWNLRGGSPKTSSIAVGATGDCTVSELLDPPVLPLPASFGPIIVDNFDSEASILAINLPTSILATFDGEAGDGSHRLAPDPTAGFLQFSNGERLESTYITVSGNQTSLTAGNWPNPERRVRVPFAMSISDAATLDTLTTPTVVGQSPAIDIRIRWDAFSGDFREENIFVRIQGTRAELLCVQPQASGVVNEVTVIAGALRTFVQAEQPPPGINYPLFVERVGSTQLTVNPAQSEVDAGSSTALFNHLVIVQVRDSRRGTIIF